MSAQIKRENRKTGNKRYSLFNTSKQISNIIREPSKLKVYSLLLKQSKDDLKDYFNTNTQSSLKNKSIKKLLLDEMFNFSEDCFKAKDSAIEIIVCDNFIITDDSNEVPRLNTKENSNNLATSKNNINSINTASYEEYVKAFNNNKRKDTVNPENALFNRNRVSVDKDNTDSDSDGSFLTISLEEKKTRPNFVSLFANDWDSPKAKKTTVNTRSSFCES